MPWDDKDKNNKPESPWGPSKAGDNEFDKLLQSGQKKLGSFLNFNQGNSGRNIAIIIAVVTSFWLLSGFYNVEQEEQAVVLRFGKYVRLANPGLNYHLPEPMEKIIIQKVTRAEKEEVGFRSGLSKDPIISQRPMQRNVPEESLMLTGDENIVDINFAVQWKIRDIEKFVFNVFRPMDTVKSAAESAMREVIGNTPITVAQTEGRSSIERSAMNLLQDILDSYNSGVEIINLQMLKVDPPAEVVDAFRDVQTSRADKEREINQAQAYQNDIIPRARGEAAQIIQDSEAYKQEVVSIATGEVSRFNSIYEQYKNSKQVTKTRLYLETMENILPGMNKVIVDKNIEKNMLPYLPLPQLNNAK
jgi:membrane protease subunit HflK